MASTYIWHTGWSWIAIAKCATLVTSAFMIMLFVNHAVASFIYFRARRRKGNDVPVPTYPALIPYIGNVFSFTLYTAKFVRRVTEYEGILTSTAIKFMGFKIFLFQDRETISRFMRHRDLCSPIAIYTFALRHFFGMPQKAIEVFVADDSGPHRRPYPESKVHFRIDSVLHQSFMRAWGGPNLIHTTQRFRRALQSQIDTSTEISSSTWFHVPDFYLFYRNIVSESMTTAVFGPALLQVNENFLEDLWAYESVLPWLARAIPSFIMPEPYRIRDRLRARIKKWQEYARDQFRECDIEADGADPCWGSEVVRELQELFTKEQVFDEEALSAHHLGMIFAANGNLVPSAVMAALRIVSVPGLAQRVRDELAANFGPDFLRDIDHTEPKNILKLPLLSSIYAETLRLHVKVFFFASPPHSDVLVGKWKLPRGSLGLVNTDGLHTEKGVWNTQNGRYPIDSFWAERFIVDPMDPLSGPLNPELRRKSVAGPRQVQTSNESSKYYSTSDVEGSWIPYGGGPAICPGRFLAKYVIMFTCAMLISEFDIEPVGEPNMAELDDWRYGMGVVRPKNMVPVRIRRREKPVRQ
ncbi:cytochrome P450 [Xylaria nigripes]|nr:cytochrome P450 [Xylaria nigripes]